MTDAEIDALAEQLQQSTPPPQKLGSIAPWRVLSEGSRTYWRERVRRGERPKTPA